MGKREYRTFGVVYVVMGIWFFLYINFSFSSMQLLFNAWRFFPQEWYYLVSVLFMFTFFGSPALVVLGIILVVSDDVWVARVSGVLFVFLVCCYLLAVYYPILVVLVSS